MTRSLTLFAAAAALALGVAAFATAPELAAQALQPTAVPTQLPPPAPTPTLPPPALPTPTVSQAQVCRFIRGRVPDAIIADALANPNKVGGYDQLRDPSKPESPFNPRGMYLSLRNVNVPFHPLFNSLVFRGGCP